MLPRLAQVKAPCGPLVAAQGKPVALQTAPFEPELAFPDAPMRLHWDEQGRPLLIDEEVHAGMRAGEHSASSSPTPTSSSLYAELRERLWAQLQAGAALQAAASRLEATESLRRSALGRKRLIVLQAQVTACYER